jgi:hypothetical protein
MTKKNENIFLTYDNEACQDGIGAQIQRIVSVYAISRTLRIGYIHSGILDFDSQVFHKSNILQKKYDIAKWSSLFTTDLKTEESLPRHYSIKVRSIKYGWGLKILNVVFGKLKILLLVKVSSPRFFTDKYPDSLLYTPEIFSLKNYENVGIKTIFKVAIHIRQGELALSQFADRYLPLEYFERVLSKVLPVLEQLDIKYEVIIPQENTKNRIPITDPKIIKSNALDPNNPFIIPSGDGFVEISQETLNSSMAYLLASKWLETADPFLDFLQLANADLLILSKSSFSFLAGLCNPKSIKIFHKFWHPTPKTWIDSSTLDSVSLAALLNESALRYRESE